VVHTAQLLYTFWNTGNSSYLDQARSHRPSGTTRCRSGDHRPGRAARRVHGVPYRGTGPGLSCQLADLYVTGDTFTARLVFRGHFTRHRRGHDQAIDFNAIDIQHVGDGTRITERLAPEGNLTFLQQAGLVTIAGSK
jgi:hypothetical protein